MNDLKFSKVKAAQTLSVNVDQVVRLTHKQAVHRLHNLHALEVSKKDKAGIYSVKNRVEFKVGEEIEVAESTPMSRQQLAENIAAEAPKPKKPIGGQVAEQVAKAVDAVKEVIGDDHG